jgi:hypothetical protein
MNINKPQRPLNTVDPNRYEAVANLIGDTPFAVMRYLHLGRKSCDVFADDAKNPRLGAIVPHIPYPDVYLFGADALDPIEMEEVAGFVAQW